MSGYVLKTAGARADCTIDWTEGYLEAGESVVEDLGWSVAPVTGPEDATVAAQRIGDKISEAVILRGVPGKVYMVSAEVLTSRGRQFARSIVLRIAEDGVAAAAA